VFIYCTGWRISEPTALLRRDVDLEQGLAITRHNHNKAGRDDVVRLHPLVVEHLKDLHSFHPELFPWMHSHRHLYKQFHLIQTTAGVQLGCTDSTEHECNTELCRSSELTQACSAKRIHYLEKKKWRDVPSIRFGLLFPK
jgi:integrase